MRINIKVICKVMAKSHLKFNPFQAISKHQIKIYNKINSKTFKRINIF